MLSKRYTINEIRAMVNESGEFKPRFGDGVENADKKNNKEGVEDILKDTERVSGRKTLKERDTKPEDTEDFNKTTLDVDFDREPSKEYKDRVKAQVEGYPSVENKKNTDARDNGGLDFKGNEKIYKQQSEKAKKMADTEFELKASGLKAREQDPEKFKSNTLFQNESKTMKRLHFKNTRFLSESQIINKVPEEYKTDGNKFYMRDNTGTDYLVECRVDNEFNHTTINVLNKINKNEINEQLNRMRSLSNYESGDYFTGTSSETRKSEDNMVSEMLDIMKKLGNTEK